MFQWIPLLHRMDPRSKLLIIFLFVCVVFIANNSLTYGILLGIYHSNDPILKGTYSFYPIGPHSGFMACSIYLAPSFIFYKRRGAHCGLGLVKIYEEGIRQGIFISMRFFLLVLVTSLLTLTTTPIEITDGIEYLLAPLKKVNFPVHELALMMSISLRFIPTLMQETDKIMKAQIARGVEFTSGPFKERLKAIIPLLIPLFISSFKRAEELAIAMEARGYRGGEGRTKYRQLKWTIVDTSMILLLMVVTALLVIFRT